MVIIQYIFGTLFALGGLLLVLFLLYVAIGFIVLGIDTIFYGEDIGDDDPSDSRTRSSKRRRASSRSRTGSGSSRSSDS